MTEGFTPESTASLRDPDADLKEDFRLKFTLRVTERGSKVRV